MDFLQNEHPDVLVLIDSQLTDLERVKRSLPGWKLLHESRPHSAHKRRLFGGITILWRSENVRIVRESGYPKGVLSFAVQDVAGQRRPVAVVALYSPPATSKFNRCGKQWSRDIMDWASMEEFRLWQKFNFVIVGGDFNWRMGSTFRRCTEDIVRDEAGARTAFARQWHQQTHLRPLYGQKGQRSGVCTSRTSNGVAEVDGISVCKLIPRGWDIEALQVPEWEEYSSRGGVHRPIGVAISAPLMDAAPDRRTAVEPPTVGGGKEAEAPVRVSPLPYGSAQYHVIADAVAKIIIQTAASLQEGDIDAAAAFSTVAEGLVAIQTEHFSVGRPQKKRGGPKVQSRTAAVVTLKNRKATKPFRRLANGMRVPATVTAQLDEHRKIIAELLNAKSKLKRDRESGTLSEVDLAEADQHVKARRAEAVKIERSAQRQLDSLSREHYKAEADRLAHMVRANPRKFFRVLNNKLPVEFGTYDESAGPSAEKREEFRAFFARLLAKLRGDNPLGVGEKYDDSVPLTDAATHAMLLEVVNWQEIYALLYPVHKMAARVAPCLPACKLCPLFEEHVEAFEPGNTHMVPPEHRPRLWTSKSAGPDGVFAETLRWSCPEARGARHAYRKAVCVGLAVIFNTVIADGKVPECPQFADSVMTALYKGVGERDDPANYRGICVPNVLAKLFGLVLGTRLSHWAVVNGVISPAQAGFVVLHGCEYHIFTLLETLRHRVRHGRDTVLVFIDFKKAYDTVSQPVAWEILEKIGIPESFIALLKSWTTQSRISMCMGGVTQEPFPQEMGVPQGGVLSPIIFNFFIEVLLRYVNARAAVLGVELAAEQATAAGANVPPALRLLALAYADDVVLICPSIEAAQQALNLVQEWAVDFGMTIGVGQGKTMAMLVSADTVKQACADDVNGMLKKRSAAAASAAVAAAVAFDDHIPSDEDPDDDHLTVFDDDEDEEWLSGSDPIVEDVPQLKRAMPRKGQAYVKGELRGAGTSKPLSYVPRPLPPLPLLPALYITVPAENEHQKHVEIPWTSLYKYLGFMVRADLLDDHAYERVEKKTKAAAERLFPHHRLVRAWPLGLKLQLLHTIVLSITANVMPLLTSMRSASESKTVRLDQLRKKIARSTLRLQSSARHAYVTAEAGLGDVMGDVTQHRIRLEQSLVLHPLRDLPEPPIACRVFDIVAAEAAQFRIGQHSLLLAPWHFVTGRVVNDSLKTCREAGAAWGPPKKRREVAPYASVVARVGERARWIAKMKHGLHWMFDSFALRPPAGARRQTAALHWTSRLRDTDAGPIPKLWPLSYRGPHGCAIVRLARRRSDLTFVISGMRQGNASMQRFPFVNSERGKNVAKDAADSNRYQSWKTCHLCDDGDDGPRYDLWHVLFECSATRDNAGIVKIREACKTFIPQLCDAIEEAVERNSESMGNTQNAGVSHNDIDIAVSDVRVSATVFQWDCEPGRWLMYTLLLALPFPEIAVRPDTDSPIWRCDPKRRVRGVIPQPNLRGMPVVVPNLADAQYALPQAVGRLYDSTILSSDALRPLADMWCKFALDKLLSAGGIVRPLRAVADARRAASVYVAIHDDDDVDTTSARSSDASSAGDSEP